MVKQNEDQTVLTNNGYLINDPIKAKMYYHLFSLLTSMEIDFCNDCSFKKITELFGFKSLSNFEIFNKFQSLWESLGDDGIINLALTH